MLDPTSCGLWPVSGGDDGNCWLPSEVAVPGGGGGSIRSAYSTQMSGVCAPVNGCVSSAEVPVKFTT